MILLENHSVPPVRKSPGSIWWSVIPSPQSTEAGLTEDDVSHSLEQVKELIEKIRVEVARQ